MKAGLGPTSFTLDGRSVLFKLETCQQASFVLYAALANHPPFIQPIDRSIDR